MQEDRLKELWQKVSALCAKQEKAPSQILRKLEDYGASADEAEALLQRLIDENFVNEERFAGAYVSDKFRFNKWGKVKIAFNLRQLGIAEDQIENALATIEPRDYEDCVLQIATQKNRQLSPSLPPRHREKKIVDFLRSKGFEFDVARKVAADLSSR